MFITILSECWSTASWIKKTFGTRDSFKLQKWRCCRLGRMNHDSYDKTEVYYLMPICQMGGYPLSSSYETFKASKFLFGFEVSLLLIDDMTLGDVMCLCRIPSMTVLHYAYGTSLFCSLVANFVYCRRSNRQGNTLDWNLWSGCCVDPQGQECWFRALCCLGQARKWSVL